MNIHQVLEDKTRKSSKGDRSRINRILIMLKGDCEILSNHYSDHLYFIYRDFYINKINSEKINYNDPTLITYVTNKCVTKLKEAREKGLSKRTKL